MATYNMTIELPPDDEETQVVVHYTFVPGYRGAREYRGGPPIEPDEPTHLEDLYIYGPDGKEIEVSDDKRERIEEEILQHLYEMSLPDYD